MSEPGGPKWLDCPCCGEDAIEATDTMCADCGDEPSDECYNDSESRPCEPVWAFFEDQSAPCPECGCWVGVSVDEGEACSVLADEESACKKLVGGV